jgi:hypothetical protein
MKKITLHTKPRNGGAFNCFPAMSPEIEPEHILANDVIFSGEFNPHGVRLWVIGNEFGALGAVWAGNDQDAFDILCDEGLSAGLMVDEPEDGEDEEISRLGNAGEPHDLSNAWIAEVDFQPARDWQTLCRFAEARGGCYSTLDF